MSPLLGALVAAMTILSATGRVEASDAIDGIWAETKRECSDLESANSRTVIDLENTSTGPILDQYENHCRIRKIDKSAKGYALRVTCYEFWENFRKNVEPTNRTIRIVMRSPDSITLQGRKHLRCSP